MLKRAFDICFALCVLLVSAPFIAGIAVWIKLDSRGPVLFRQERIGWRGKPFVIYKLRTMQAAGRGEDRQITVGVDPRITQAGHFLRRYKLDELPQFVNVLRGDMSVVGPRPEVPRYVALYPVEARELVLSVRPGITDLASVAFRDESSLLAAAKDPEVFYVQEIMPRKLAYCLQYVQKRNMWLDLTILMRTVAAILGRRS